MNEFKFFEKNKIYKPGDTVAIICRTHDQYTNWINHKRRNSIIVSGSPFIRNDRFDTINGVRYVCVNRSEKVRGYLINDVIVLENAHENPFFDEINLYIQPCLVNEIL